MKKISKILLCFMILLLTACVGNNEVKNYYGKKFIGKFVIAPLIMVGVIMAFTGVFGAQNVLETRTFIM